MNDSISKATIEAAAGVIRRRTSLRPAMGLITGSGLSDLAQLLNESIQIPYSAIPGFPLATVKGHPGQLVVGTLDSHPTLLMQGRVHYYEGYSMTQVTFPVHVMRQLGVETLIVTNAAGGLNPDYHAGDLMLIRDHINLPGLAGINPLYGPNDDELGPRFPNLTHAYDPELRRLSLEAAGDLEFTLHQGVYAMVGGPSFETPAELRYLRTLGADAVGMSTASEVIVARYRNMRVLGISTITNVALPYILEASPSSPQTEIHQEVLQTSHQAIPRLVQLIRHIVKKL